MARNDKAHKKKMIREGSNVWGDATDALSLFKKFHAKEPREVYEMDFEWPMPQTIVGIGHSVSYRSDKWNDEGDFLDYIHHHKHKPRPYIIKKAKKGEEILEEPILPPDPAAFAVLGRTLDFEYHGLDEKKSNPPKKEDFLFGRGRITPTEKMPILAALQKELLVVIEDGKPAVLIWSPRLIVTRRGIER